MQPDDERVRAVMHYKFKQQCGMVPKEDGHEACSRYDIAMGEHGLVRVVRGTVPDPLLEGPLPEEFWSLPIMFGAENTLKENKRLKVFANFVTELCDLSKCCDRHTAAIITDSDLSQVYSIGINGGPRGSVQQCLCNMPGKYTCVHAEANAIAKCTATDIDKVMICSLSPCVTCAAMIINSGFSTVYYIEEWKDKAGLELLAEAGITAKKI